MAIIGAAKAPAVPANLTGQKFKPTAVAHIALATTNTYTDAAVNAAVNAAIDAINTQVQALVDHLNDGRR
jgi:hypothetical protein